MGLRGVRWSYRHWVAFPTEIKPGLAPKGI